MVLQECHLRTNDNKKNNIDMIEHNETRDVLLVAFSSILRSVSNATSGFGNLMINKKSGTDGIGLILLNDS